MFVDFQWDLNFLKYRVTGRRKYDYNFLAPLLTQTATQTLKLCYFIRTHLSNETQWVALLWWDNHPPRCTETQCAWLPLIPWGCNYVMVAILLELPYCCYQISFNFISNHIKQWLCQLGGPLRLTHLFTMFNWQLKCFSSLCSISL